MENWNVFTEETQIPSNNAVCLCFWQQDRGHKGYALFRWIGDRWVPYGGSRDGHGGLNYIKAYIELPEEPDLMENEI